MTSTEVYSLQEANHSTSNLEALQDEVLSIDLQGMAVDGSSVSRRTRHGLATDLHQALRGKGPSAAFASKHSRWAVTLRAAIQHTSLSTVTKEQWIDSIANTLHSPGIEWMPGSHRGKITFRRVIKIIQQGIMPYASQVVVVSRYEMQLAVLYMGACRQLLVMSIVVIEKLVLLTC